VESWYYAGGGDNAGTDFGARSGGNGRGCGQIPWIITPTLPPGRPRSLLSFLVLLRTSFVFSTALTAIG